MGFTAPKTWIAEKMTKEDLNTYIRDNQNFLKANVALDAAAELTISTGAVTKTQSFHKIDTEADTSSDDLDNIGGGGEGEILIIRCVSASRVVTVKDGTGNIALGGDVILDDPEKMLVLIYDGTNWCPLITPAGDIALSYGIYGYSFYGLCVYSS